MHFEVLCEKVLYLAFVIYLMNQRLANNKFIENKIIIRIPLYLVMIEVFKLLAMGSLNLKRN